MISQTLIILELFIKSDFYKSFSKCHLTLWFEENHQMRGTAMTGEKFTLMQYSVHAILGLIDAEDFVIPEIQRPFVWKRSQVRDLIDSLYNGYPTGYIITWKNPDVKTKDGGKANGKKVLIDGQQRVTALMAAISGREVLDDDFNKERIKIAFNPLAEDETKRFAVQDASHLKDKK